MSVSTRPHRAAIGTEPGQSRTTTSTKATKGPRRAFRRLATAAVSTLLAAAAAPLMVLPAQAAVAGMGPVDPQNGFPTWYSDGTVKLQFCYQAGQGCLSEPPNAGAPAAYPDNFPEEAFWFAAEATGENLGLYEAALEGAHMNGAVVPGEQMGFGRLRFDVDNLVAGKTYTITHPYGVHTFVAEADKKNPSLGFIRQTIDAGVCDAAPGSPCDWAGVGRAFLGDNAAGTTSTFLRQIGAAAGTIGDINTARPVTGAPSGNNFVQVDGPDAGGPGVDTLKVSTFTVQGRIFNGSGGEPTTPDLVSTSDSGKSTTDNITRVTTPTLAGSVPGLGATETDVSLMVDGATTPAVTTRTVGGKYSAALPVALPNGVHRVQARIANPARATDAAAPEFLTSLTLTFTVDATAPLATVVAPFPSNPSADRTPTFTFTSNQPQSTFECQLIPSNTSWAPCVSGITYDAQQDGNYTFNVRATDAAGNVSPLLTASSFSWHLGAADTVRPSVSARTPGVNAMSFSQTANVAATFSESVLGVSTNTFTLAKASTPTVVVPATVTRNGYTNQWVLNPTASLSPDTKYVAKLVGSTTGIRDFSNNPLVSGTATPVTWNFTTGPAPTVTTKSPALNATAVSRTANVTATFSENVAGVSGTTFTLKSSTGTTVSAAVTYNATTRVAVLNPGVTLAARTKYTATLSGGSTKIRDGALNPLTSISWSFTTA